VTFADLVAAPKS